MPAKNMKVRFTLTKEEEGRFMKKVKAGEIILDDGIGDSKPTFAQIKLKKKEK